MASDPYTRMKQKFWTDPKVKSLSSYGKLLYAYILSCPHRNIIGCYYLPKGYAQADTKIPMRDFEKAWQEVEKAEVFRYDEDTEIILILKYLKHNPLENPNQTTSAIKVLSNMQDTTLFGELAESVRSYCKQTAQPLLQRLVERLGKPFAKPFDEPLSEKDAFFGKQDKRYKIEDSYGGGDGASARMYACEDSDGEAQEPVTPDGLYQRYFGTSPTDSDRDMCALLLATHDPEVVEVAFHRASEQDIKTLSYVKGILENYKARGVKDMEGVAADDMRHEDDKRRRNNG